MPLTGLPEIDDSSRNLITENVTAFLEMRAADVVSRDFDLFTQALEVEREVYEASMLAD